MKGQSLRGALSRGPQLERLSPGVYRGAQGQLVNQQGRQLQQQPQRPVAPIKPGQQGQYTNAITGGVAPTRVPASPLPSGVTPEQLGQYIGGMTGQQNYDPNAKVGLGVPGNPQMQNPSYTPQNYFNTPYRPWWLPPQNSPWWYQPQQQQEQPAQQDQNPVGQMPVKPQGQ